ncbi:hypothetical protein SDC9_160545 [bioreactor metagenome]|uniref:Uncharacterized protein n=1 Tax=bioreactor metagenome TaxID=1076179 RepID=A0A645FLD8_9ZZZZ
MLSCFQHQLRRAIYRLGGQTVSLVPGETVQYTAVSHGFDQKHGVGWCGARDGRHNIHQLFVYDLNPAKAFEYGHNLFNILLCHQLIWTNRRVRFTDKGRCTWLSPDHLSILTQNILDITKFHTHCNDNHNRIFFGMAGNLAQNIGIDKRLNRQHQVVRSAGDTDI